jgi:hypothetical protein
MKFFVTDFDTLGASAAVTGCRQWIPGPHAAIPVNLAMVPERVDARNVSGISW